MLLKQASERWLVFWIIEYSLLFFIQAISKFDRLLSIIEYAYNSEFKQDSSEDLPFSFFRHNRSSLMPFISFGESMYTHDLQHNSLLNLCFSLFGHCGLIPSSFNWNILFSLFPIIKYPNNSEFEQDISNDLLLSLLS